MEDSKYTKKIIALSARKSNIDIDGFDMDELIMGMDVELEHGTVDSNTNVSDDDPLITGKIALAHLNELPDYYDRLEKMEEEGEAELSK